MQLLASCEQFESVKQDGRFRLRPERVESFATSKDARRECLFALDKLEEASDKEEVQYYCRDEIWINTYGLYESDTRRLLVDFKYKVRT